MSEQTKHLQDWRRRGYRAEFDLIVYLRMHGFKAIRIGFNPSPNPFYTPLPDAVASRNGHFYTFEVKKAKSGYSYIKYDQIDKLFGFLDIIPISPEMRHAIIAVKGKMRWRFWEITKEQLAKIEKKGNFRVQPNKHSNWNPKE